METCPMNHKMFPPTRPTPIPPGKEHSHYSRIKLPVCDFLEEIKERIYIESWVRVISLNYKHMQIEKHKDWKIDEK